MKRYFIHMAYDGTNYHGWQVQPNGLTVQEVLENALSVILQEEIKVTGAGRTDTGVHASFYMAHFDIRREDSYGSFSGPDDPQFLFKLNRFLPEDIVIYKILEVTPDLHARFSATYRTYHYHISTRKPLFNRNYSHYVYGLLDLEAMNRCCGIIMKTTDFTSFSKLHTDVKTNNCKVIDAHWKEVDGAYLFEIKADRFLRNMVRSLVGTLLDAGQGKLDIGGFQSIVDAKDRGKAGQSVAAAGLFLVDIGYEGISSTQFLPE
ncbi:MAG: tRNA pseudouridine(38-40) synthase TruA [Bacteroides sp.]|nr:tRNA pseudouridine(38-40) synthase TruA [Bacteroides sp.]